MTPTGQQALRDAGRENFPVTPHTYFPHDPLSHFVMLKNTDMQLCLICFVFTRQLNLNLTIFRHDIYRANFAILNASLVTRNRNVVRMLVCIVVVFAIFWLPGQLSWLVETFSEHSDKWNTLKEVSSLFIFANSAFNPLIFFYYNDEYRIKGFSVLFKDARKVTSPCHKRSARNCKRISFGPVQMLSNV